MIIENFYYFSSPIYKTNIKQFLDLVKTVSDESLDLLRIDRPLNEYYPVIMSGNIQNDPRIHDFVKYVSQTGWNILNDQGYQMDNLNVYTHDMWAQEHHKRSGMETHSHGYGIQLVGFYFLEVPDDSNSNVVFYDPRPAKTQIDLHERNISNITLASQAINFSPKIGDLFITNAWLQHSFNKNISDKPFKFVHFNLSVTQTPPEII